MHDVFFILIEIRIYKKFSIKVYSKGEYNNNIVLELFYNLLIDPFTNVHIKPSLPFILVS